MRAVRIKNLGFKALPVIILSLILLLTDVFFNIPERNVSTSDMLPVLPKQATTQSQRAQADAILALYSQFDTPAQDNQPEATVQQIESVGLTQQQQDQQQGLLRALYINDDVYRLSAIVNQGQYVASLSMTDVNNTPESISRRLALKTGDTLHQYQVVSVTSRRITLRHQQRELWLQLFTPELAPPAAN